MCDHLNYRPGSSPPATSE